MGTLPPALSVFLAPLPNFLHGKISTRILVIMGVIVTSLGFVMPALATCDTMIVMFAMYGLLAGVGSSFMLNLPFFLLAEYFPYEHPRHVLATGAAVLGYPAGRESLKYNIISN